MRGHSKGVLVPPVQPRRTPATAPDSAVGKRTGSGAYAIYARAHSEIILASQQLRLEGRRRGNGTGSKLLDFAVIRAATMVTDYGNPKLCPTGRVVVPESGKWAGWKTPMPTILIIR
jgi:hypothetical protein